jgi:hypothetical protein
MPNGAGSGETFEQIVVHSIHCGIKDAVDHVKDEDNLLIAKALNNHPGKPLFLELVGHTGHSDPDRSREDRL